MLKAISIVQRLAQVYTNSIFPYCGVSTIITIMPETIRNLLKQTGVFKCRHPAHKRFGYDVSPYHIMVKKGCYPDGCMEFLWRCRLLGKGKKCPRGYKHVGKGCFSCPEFYDEKLTFNPGSELNDKALNRFMEDLVEFRGWLETMRGRRIRFSGLVDSVKPHLRMTIESRGRRVRMDGYYAAFMGGYLDNDYFEDKIYLKLNTSFLERTEAAPGDREDNRGFGGEMRGMPLLFAHGYRGSRPQGNGQFPKILLPARSIGFGQLPGEDRGDNSGREEEGEVLAARIIQPLFNFSGQKRPVIEAADPGRLHLRYKSRNFIGINQPRLFDFMFIVRLYLPFDIFGRENMRGPVDIFGFIFEPDLNPQYILQEFYLGPGLFESLSFSAILEIFARFYSSRRRPV